MIVDGSLDWIVNQFAYHPATTTTASFHAAIRDKYIDFVTELFDLIPNCDEKTLALRKLQESLMYANLAVALQAPADTTSTRSIARTLPTGIAESSDEIDWVDLGAVIADLRRNEVIRQANEDRDGCGA